MLIMKPSQVDKGGVEAWQSLVHVCRRWRNLVFESPRSLNLQLFCTPKTPAKDTLDVWPALPLIVKGNMDVLSRTDNIIAALGQINRVRQVELFFELEDWHLDIILAPMHVSFPELTDLYLWSLGETRVIPDSFLGGSAPRLRSFNLVSIPFPGLPKLLLSATQLVQLHLYNIPHSGYISPKAMVALLSVSSSLESLHLEFQSPQSRPGSEGRSLAQPERSILPALHEFGFEGFTEYLEELVTHIDTPRLDKMDITFSNETNFDCPRLAQFINCTPILRALDEAHLEFKYQFASVTLRYRTPKSVLNELRIKTSMMDPIWQPSVVAAVVQLCKSSLPPLSIVEDLNINSQKFFLEIHTIESALWLELLLPFTAVKNFYLSGEYAPDIAAALQELAGDKIKEVLPRLQNIFVEGLEPSGPLQENIKQFVAARQLLNHHITVSVGGKTPQAT